MVAEPLSLEVEEVVIEAAELDEAMPAAGCTVGGQGASASTSPLSERPEQCFRLG